MRLGGAGPHSQVGDGGARLLGAHRRARLGQAARGGEGDIPVDQWRHVAVEVIAVVATAPSAGQELEAGVVSRF